MKKIRQYETVHDFWDDLNDFSNGNVHFEPVPKRRHQEQLRAKGSAVDTRLIKRNHIGPTSLRVSVARPDSPQRSVTKLDFIDKGDAGTDSWRKVGHLVLPPAPGQRVHGLQVANISEIPDVAQPALDTLDRGVQLLLKQATVQLWRVGPRP